MATAKDRMKNDIAEKVAFLEPFFIWLRLFYPKARGFSFVYLLYYFIPQKLLRINGSAGWPMHFTSKVLNPEKVEMGNHCAPGMSPGCYIQAKNGIKIGHNLWLGPHVGLISANHDINDYEQWLKDQPIVIGDNVWIGMNSVVMPGVKIGNNVVIGANSVVNADIPDNSIAVGSPCKVLKTKEPYAGRDYSGLS